MTALRVGFVGPGSQGGPMAELAGPLRAKDVGILADVVGQTSPQLPQMAIATVNAMHLNDPEASGAQ